MDDNTGHIHPKTARPGFLYLYEPPDQGKQDGNSCSRRDKILYGKPKRLREVTQCGFAGISLPVGVSHKTDGSVERQIPLYVGQLLGIPRKRPL